MLPVRDDVRWIDDDLVSDLFLRAAAHPRRRLNLNFHRTLDENPHRFLNALVRGTYIRPHRHLFPPKAESFVVLSGALLFLLFDDEGGIESGRILAAAGAKWHVDVRPEFRSPGPAQGVDIDPGLWHTLLPLSEHALIFEVKPGPYRKADDKEFAPWAPAEDDPASTEYLDSLVRRCLIRPRAAPGGGREAWGS